MVIRGCIFDLDGVIVNTAAHHFEAWKLLSEELGVSFDESDNEKLKGVSRVDSLEYILDKGQLILDSATKIRLMDQKNAHYLALADSTSPIDVLPGVVSLLDELDARNIQIALGSSSKNAQRILTKLGLFDRFSVIVDGNHLTLSKPDPQVFEKGAAQMGLAPENCLVFEDAAAGVEAALNGGFPVVGVGKAEDLPGAEVIIPDFSAITWDVLKSMLKIQG